MSTMMVQMLYLKELKPNELDQYLARGWFRSSSLLFRTSLICMEEDVHSVVNIRLELDQFVLKKRLRKLLVKNDKQFRIEYGYARIDEERELLYHQNKNRFKGFVFDSLDKFLCSDNYNRKMFDTREVCVYDGDALVAVSYFDVGGNSMASIIGLHDEEYSKFSLGIYTMLKEIQFAKDVEIQFFYPGYILLGEPSFDYKLKLGNYQYYNWNGKWKLFTEIHKEVLVVEKLKKKLEILSQYLGTAGIPNYQYVYPLFSSGHVKFYKGDLFKSPIFIVCFKKYRSEENCAIEYDLDTNEYKVVVLKRNKRLKKMFFDITYQRNKPKGENYIDDLLEYVEILLTESSMEKLVSFLMSYMKKT